MRVVSNTSPICYLSWIDQLEILPRLYTSIAIPFQVLAELLHTDSPVAAKLSTPPAWLEIEDTINPHYNYGLDLGESAAIALAMEVGADRLLIDDNQGRIVARHLGINVTGTLGVILAAAKLKLLDGIVAVDQLQNLGFYAAENLFAQVRDEINAIP